MARPRIVALYSDLGLEDVRAGVFRGIVRTLAPEAVVLDVCHRIRPGDRHEAAFFLLSAVPFLPRGTIHVCLVGPGTRGVAVRAGGHTLLASDDGVLVPVVEALGGLAENRLLTNTRLHRSRTGAATVLGRDVLGPVAAQLVRGIDFNLVGEDAGELAGLPGFAPAVTADRIDGRVLHADASGRAVTNLVLDDLGGRLDAWDVTIGETPSGALVTGEIGFLETLPAPGAPVFENGAPVVALRRMA